MKKNVSKSKPKFLHCFRPVDVDMVLETKAVRRRQQVRTVEAKEDKKAASLTKTMSLDRGCSSPANSEKSRMPPRPNRTFSKAVKAVVFETILAKRACDRKVYRQDSFGSKRCFSFRSEASLNLGGDESVKKFEETKPNSEMSFHSRSSSSSSALSSSSSVSESKRLSKTLSDPTKQSLRNPQNPAAKPKNTEVISSGFNSGTYFLLISLAMTVFWGKVIAILVSSIWLYFCPWRSSSKISPEYVRKWSKAECRDNNKRVIMEGLIERKNHLHHHPHQHQQQRDRGH